MTTQEEHERYFDREARSLGYQIWEGTWYVFY